MASHREHGDRAHSGFHFAGGLTSCPVLRGLLGWSVGSWLIKKLTFGSLLLVPHQPGVRRSGKAVSEIKEM